MATPHLRAALSRIGDPAKEAGMGKALLPIKAQQLDADEEAAFWDGRIPRRLLAVPFGGPIPSPKSKLGVDLDGEFFSENTDIYGPYPALRQERERLVDFHHSYQPPGRGYGDPTGMMKGHIIGKSILDPNPDEDGWWVDFWVRAGDARVAMIKRIAERGRQLFGSSQPAKGVEYGDDGEILVWPFILETISPAPQNTYSVLRPKAMLDGLNESGIDLPAGLRSLLGDLDALGAELPRRFSVGGGDEAVKAGSVSISDALDSWEALRDSLKV